MRYITRRSLTGVGLVLMASLLARPAQGQNATKEMTFGPFTGTVVDSAEKPVASASVWLLGGEYSSEPRVMAQTTTDNSGRFNLSEAKWATSFTRTRALMLVARDSQGRVGGQTHYYGPLVPPFGAAVFQNITIQLQDVKDFRGRLVDTSGKPIAKATVSPLAGSSDRLLGHTYSSYRLPTALANDLATRTADDGTFTLRNQPAQGHHTLAVSADGFGEVYATVNPEKPTRIELRRVGRVHGSITCDKTPGAAAGIEMQIHAWKTLNGESKDRSCGVSYFDRTVSRSDGTFDFAQVPSGTSDLSPEVPEASPYYVTNLEPLDVKPGETTTVSLALKPAVKVQGKVVDQQTGKGVSGVRVSLYFQDEEGFGGRDQPVITDTEGAFALYSRPGAALVQVANLPQQYVGSQYPQQVQQVDLTKDTTLPPIQLQRASALEGIVVDESGKPVADAEIRWADLGDLTTLHQRVIPRSDAAGKFSLKGVSPKTTLIIKGRSKKAAGDPVNVVPAELKGPVRLVLDDKTSFGMQGIVTDEAGKPIPNAEVTLTVLWWFGTHGTYLELDSCKTDNAGQFEFGGLWADDRYDVCVSAAGCEKYQSPKILGTPGGVHDFGKITLLAANGIVTGRVVDSSGKPVAGARVFNSGDGPELMETLSDTTGRFHLQGFHKGPVFVFAEKNGYRFTGQRTTTGATDVVLTMLKSGEPVPPRSAPAAPSAEEEKKAARRVLMMLWTKDQDDKQRLLNRMASIDPEQAQKLAKQSNLQVEKPSDPTAIQKVADEDLDEALTLLAERGAGAFYPLKDLANHFATSDPDKAMRCAEEAIVRARSMDQPWRAVGLAQMGALVTRLGNKEAGRNLAHEAVQMASAWSASGPNTRHLGSIASAAASCDLAGAMGLLEGMERNERDAYFAEVVGSLDDLEKAKPLLEKVSPGYVQIARARLAYHIAATHPAEAVRLVEETPKHHGYEGEDLTEAKTYGWLARAIAPRDPALAHSLVDRAFAVYLHPRDRRHWLREGDTAQPAILAVHAHLIGYPDMESVAYRVLATRPTTADASSPVEVQECCITRALFLALADPATAKEMLQTIEQATVGADSGGTRVQSYDWLVAWALADPQHAADLAVREWDSAKDKAAKDEAQHVLLKMVGLWMTAPGERLNYLARRSGYSILFDQEE